MAIYEEEKKRSVEEVKELMKEFASNYSSVMSMLSKELGDNNEFVKMLSKNPSSNQRKLINAFMRMSDDNFTMLASENPSRAVEVMLSAVNKANKFVSAYRICTNNAFGEDKAGRKANNLKYKAVEEFLSSIEDVLADYTVDMKAEEELMGLASVLGASVTELKRDLADKVNEQALEDAKYEGAKAIVIGRGFTADNGTLQSELEAEKAKNAELQAKLTAEEAKTADAVKRAEEEQKSSSHYYTLYKKLLDKQKNRGTKAVVAHIMAGFMAFGILVGGIFAGKGMAKRTIQEKDLAYAGLSNAYDTLDNKYDDLFGKYTAQGKEFEDFKKRVESSELAHSEAIQQWQNNYDKLLGERNDFEKKYNDEVLKAQDLQKQLDEALKGNNDALIASLRTQIRNQEQTIDSLSNALSSSNSQLSTMTGKYTTLESKYNDLKKQLDEHQCEYPSELINSLKEQVAEANKKAEEADAKAKAAAEEARKANEAKAQADANAEKAKQEADAAKAERDRLAGELENAKATIKDLNNQLANLNKGNEYQGDVKGEGPNQGGASQVTDKDKENNDNKGDNGHVGGGIDREPDVSEEPEHGRR